MWGVTYRKNFIQYKTHKEIIATNGTIFYLYSNLEDAIEKRDAISDRNKWAVVVSLSEVKFIPCKK